MKLWFSADTHEGHANIIKYCKRPFKDVIEQHEVFVKNFNARISDDDMVIFDGDFCFRNSPGGKTGEGTTRKASDWLKDYKGKWIFIAGNHDSNNSLKTPIERLYLRHGGKRICVVHNPIHADPHCELNFVGHVHNSWKIQPLGSKSIMINVGVDVWNFKPVSFEELMKRINEWKRGSKGKNDNKPSVKHVKIQANS